MISVLSVPEAIIYIVYWPVLYFACPLLVQRLFPGLLASTIVTALLLNVLTGATAYVLVSILLRYEPLLTVFCCPELGVAMAPMALLNPASWGDPGIVVIGVAGFLAISICAAMTNCIVWLVRNEGSDPDADPWAASPVKKDLQS